MSTGGAGVGSDYKTDLIVKMNGNPVFFSPKTTPRRQATLG